MGRAVEPLRQSEDSWPSVNRSLNSRGLPNHSLTERIDRTTLDSASVPHLKSSGPWLALTKRSPVDRQDLTLITKSPLHYRGGRAASRLEKSMLSHAGEKTEPE